MSSFQKDIKDIFFNCSDATVAVKENCEPVLKVYRETLYSFSRYYVLETLFIY